MRRFCSSTSTLALLLVCFFFFFHCAAAGRLLLPAAVPSLVLVPQQESESGVKQAGAGGLELQEGAAGNGNELSDMMGAEVEEEAACEEGQGNDECMQRRLLRDAHLDYIYTQHTGKP